jgi:hypothetical protein
MKILMQATQPDFNAATIHKMLGGALIGTLVAVGVDLHSYGQSSTGAVWSWKLTAAHAIYGAIAGGLGAIGISVATT